MKKIPEINFDANHWYQLIGLTVLDIKEPPSTQHFSKFFRNSTLQIQQFIDNTVKPDTPDFLSLSIQRSVKLV